MDIEMMASDHPVLQIATPVDGTSAVRDIGQNPPPNQTRDSAANTLALGRIKWLPRDRSAEMELSKYLERFSGAAEANAQMLNEILRQPVSRYLVRQLSWILTIHSQEAYLLIPRDPTDLLLLVNAIRTDPHSEELDLVVGTRGPVAPSEMFSGVPLPRLIYETIVPVNIQEYIRNIPTLEISDEDRDKFQSMSSDVLSKLIACRNDGSSDACRSFVHLALRDHEVYKLSYGLYNRNFVLSGIRSSAVTIGGFRKTQRVILTFTHSQTGFQEQYSVDVDVTGMWPFVSRGFAAFA
jgi:hypothetical protein